MVQVINCSVTTADGVGVSVDDQWTIRDSTVSAAGANQDGIGTTDGLAARIERCTITTANGHGIFAEDDWIISGCTISATGTNKDGITTTDGVRVRVDNCRITTGSGHGILAEDDWVISNCTIKAAGGARRGIYGPNAIRVQVANCDVTTADGAGILVDENWTIRDTTVSAAGTDRDGIGGSADGAGNRITNCSVTSAAGDGIMPSGNAWYIQGTRVEAKAAGKAGVTVIGKNDVTVRECDVIAGDAGVRVDNADNFQAFGSTFRGDVYGGLLNLGSDNALFEDCSLFGGGVLMSTPAQTKGVWLTGTTMARPSATFQGCRIIAQDASSGGLSPGVFAVDVDNANPARLIDCEITSTNTATSTAPAYGVHTSVEPGSLGAILVGGVIKSSSGDEKEKEVYDLYRLFVNDVPKEAPLMSGTRLSKWFGGIRTAERPRPETQRTINADPESPTAIEDTPINQGTGCIENDTDHIENPDVYRVLSVQGSADATGVVSIIGTNWAGDMICDRIDLAGNAIKRGEKPFKTVTKICPGTGMGSFTVGTTNELGLYHPISDAADVLQQGRKLNNQTAYTLESNGTPHPKRGTVEVTFSQGETDTSFEWFYLATK